MKETMHCTVCNKTDHNTDKCWGPGTQVVVPVYQPEKVLPCYGIGIPPASKKPLDMKSTFDSIFGKK